MKKGTALLENCNASATKKGPGRFHKASHKKTSPVASKGAPFGFVLHTNPEKNERRKAIKAAGGIRQFKKVKRIAA